MRKRRFRYNIRDMLIVMVIVSPVFFYAGNVMHERARELAAIEQFVEKTGHGFRVNRGGDLKTSALL